MAEEDICKTAFVTPDGYFQYKRMPFGLKNAPSHFQRQMELAMEGLQCDVYLDDILIYGESEGQFLENLEQVLKRLRKYKLQANLEKCKLGVASVHELGYVLNSEGRQIDPMRYDVIERLPVPEDKKTLRGFLGYVNYFNEFIPHFSAISASLYALLHETTKWKWNAEEQTAFETLKSSIGFDFPSIAACPIGYANRDSRNIIEITT